MSNKSSPLLPKIIKASEIILIFFWLITIKESDSIYTPYLITGISGIICCLKRKQFGRQKHLVISIVFSFIFTFFICSANYSLFPTISTPRQIFLNIITIISLIAGSFITFYNILIYLPSILTNLSLKRKNKKDKFYKYKPSTIFLLSFAIIALTYLIIFFLCKYPGNLSPDSIRQVTQNLTGEYRNWHPFTHTILIGLFIKIGLNIFGDINTGVALYSIFSILFMAMVFAYSLVTLYQKNTKKQILILLLLFYSLCPYHIMYSMTMWKDVIFSGFILLFAVTQYRLFQHIGSNWANYLLLTLSSLGICLFRNNGIYVMAMFLIMFIAFFLIKNIHSKRIITNTLIITFAILFSFIYNKTILPALNVAPAELIESLSIPAQQITRTIHDNTIKTEQLDLLNNVIDTDQAIQDYDPYFADPIKKQIWHNEEKNLYLKNHKADLFMLYLNLGLNYPLSYYYAWADITRGYYNSGYIYWIMANGVEENSLGINKLHEQNLPNKLFDNYLSLFENNSTLRIIYCIGFAVWITIILLYVAIIKKDKTLSMLITLPLLVIMSLLVATPVSSEFRYAYAVFCCLPFFSVSILLPSSREKRQSKRPTRSNAL